VDTQQFCPITHTKSYHKAKYGIPTDSIVLGSVMRNQKRKLIPALFSMLSKLIEKTNNRKIYLHLHTSYPENGGWNIPELLQEYGVYNNVLFTYYVPDNGTVFVSPYKGALTPCPNDASKTAVFPGVVKGLPNEKLVEIYNLFDVYIQYAICEGLGIPQLEAASCGIPIMAVNYSGMEEITTKVEGAKISHTLSKELETGSDRAVPDDDCLINEIISWMSLSLSQKKEKSKRTRALLIDHYGWDKTANEWMRILDTLEPKNIWDQPLLTRHETQVPDNLTARQFITYIVEELMKEPLLLKTYFIQSLIRSVDEKFSNVGGHINEVAIQQIVKTLEVSLNNKMICEQLRSGAVPLSESYLVCDNK
jgi:glycosyltransferase involved in cell wall biosynthesis